MRYDDTPPPSDDDGYLYYQKPLNQQGYKQLDLLDLLCSFNGRISRSQYWTGIAAIILGGWVIGAVASAVAGVMAGRAVTAVIALFSIFLAIKRFHDMNLTGWYAILSCIPPLNILVNIFWLGMVPGTVGTNQYGPDSVVRL